MPHPQAEALYERGLALCRTREFRAAEAYLLSALAVDDQYPIAWHDLAGVFVKTRRLKLAERTIRKAVALNPDFPESRFMLSGILLALGSWQEGWQEFESRFACRQTAPLHISMPRWNGEPLQGKRLLVVADQGFGDTLQFIRFAELLPKLGATVYIWGPDPTTPLLARLPYVAQAQTYIQELSPADYYVPLLSLPHLLGALNPAQFAPPYLTYDESRRRAFEEKLGPRDGRSRIALAWAGSPTQRDNVTRSMPLAALAPLLTRSDIRWISIQKGDARAELAEFADRIEDWSEDLSSFDASASLFMALDGVISVCSAPIHLAGALDRPAIACLSTEADWRWGMPEDPATPWYPKTRLARQTAAGDWAGIVPQIEHHLASWQSGTTVPAITGEFRAPKSFPVDHHEWLFV